MIQDPALSCMSPAQGRWASRRVARGRGGGEHEAAAAGVLDAASAVDAHAHSAGMCARRGRVDMSRTRAEEDGEGAGRPGHEHAISLRSVTHPAPCVYPVIARNNRS